ncbi:transposase [Lachnoclostridium sp.]|uniref:IS66 family insertion sequence element accessory protein TnpA n=1 Tax=Lachnoclostridium sp. TaxID=2028282 RepID=UPI00289B2AAC|nr:transposase [Lachnoclostridium sp.]
MRQHYKHYSDGDKKRLIMECRQSGMSDYQWCRENGINSSTFYNWVKKLRNSACQEELIEPVVRCNGSHAKQDVVKVNVLPKEEPVPIVYQSTSVVDSEPASIEINLNGCNIKIHNNADPGLLAHAINLLRGALC